MNYKYVLDSYAWSEFFDGSKEGLIVKDLLDQGNVATSVVALAELSDKCAREQRDVQLLVRFIQMKAAVVLLTPEIAIPAGKLKQELRKIAKNISLADALHFQTAKLNGALFVTGDPDFKEIKEGVLFLKEPEKNGRENNNEK